MRIVNFELSISYLIVKILQTCFGRAFCSEKMTDQDEYCLDIGAHSVKVVVLLDSGQILVRDDLRIRSTVDVVVNENKVWLDYSITDFIPMINMSMSSIMESNMNAANVIKDEDNYPKLSVANNKSLYFEEVLTHLLEKVKSEIKDKNIKLVAVNLAQSDITNCAMILAGLKYKTVSEQIAITNAYLATKFDTYVKERILAIDLGYNGLKLHNISINGKQVDYEFESYSDWSSHEFTLALFNYVMDQSKGQEFDGLMEECENAKAVLSVANAYKFEIGGAMIHRDDFEKCISPIVQKLFSKLKEFLKYDLGWDGNIILIGASFNIPLVLRTVKKLFQQAFIVNVGVKPEYVIAYGTAVYLSKCYNMYDKYQERDQYSATYV